MVVLRHFCNGDVPANLARHPSRYGHDARYRTQAYPFGTGLVDGRTSVSLAQSPATLYHHIMGDGRVVNLWHHFVPPLWNDGNFRDVARKSDGQ